MATIAVILKSPPYGNQHSAEGVEFALASTNYGHECSVFFVGSGVLQLLDNQQPTELKNHQKQLKVMPLYDIQACYACSYSLQKHQVLPASTLKVTALTPEQLSATLTTFDHTVTF